jgi:ATP-dependent helicase HrpB
MMPAVFEVRGSGLNPHVSSNLPSLPIDAVLREILAALGQSPCLVLRAPTGAGKTTRVPPALLDAGLAGDRELLLLEPRRLAARAAARRMATERNGRLGDEIGYQVRFDQQCGPKTRILAVTEGILLRRLQDDPFLESTGIIVFDEFHERSLASDLALAMTLRVQQTVRPDLRIVVMSATLTPGPICEFLGGCPLVESEGRLHPVAIQYAPPAARGSPVDAAAEGVRRMLDETTGDLLVFLPGVPEIRKLHRALEPLAAEAHVALFDLYGDLPPEQQDAALGPSSRRKIVLATNVAETSVTIAGITGVVDTGLARVLQFDPATGLDRLHLQRISRASTEQRAGRAGRTAPGVCLRLWSEREQQGRPEREIPEIGRVDLAGTALELLCWGEHDLAAFPWFEAPAPAAIEQALDLLDRLGAIERLRGTLSAQPTDLGRQIARVPVHPRLSRMLLAADQLGWASAAALAAALLSERDPFQRETGPQGPRTAQHRSQSDLLDRVSALLAFEQRSTRDSLLRRINPSAARFVLQARDQLLRSLRSASNTKRCSLDEALGRAVLAAFPDRLASRREAGSRRAVMVGGKGVRLADESAVTEAELFICLDVDARRTEGLARLASAVERNWLDAARLQTTTDVHFDVERDRVTAIRRTTWEDLILDQAPTSPPADADIGGLLADAAAADLDRALPLNNPAVHGFLARVRSLRQWMPELGLPAFDADELSALLPTLCAGKRSFAELQRAPLVDYLRGALTSAQLQAVEREAPERIAVPSGNRIALEYNPGSPPVLAVRIQEIFGLTETPRIAAGRVPVLLHLLAPNYRPQQITSDLRSFWDNTYEQVRKDLRRRYPKHAWPEDPWNAPPERRPGRRSS